MKYRQDNSDLLGLFNYRRHLTTKVSQLTWLRCFEVTQTTELGKQM
ncbi:hypothetical protein Goarm_017300 [Gossypium armourianum]|uniref:Uncharacterized protein n=1 Tax=Gossypium armourianum TaxID=34283 RepID=A0A7J9JEX9_9ROSI|nr:hypothetical protein [Gossypium armourianum]